MEFKLLVVDDEREITALLAEFLLGHGYRLLLAGSGDEAVAILEREPVDLVVLDLNMPGLSGEDVIRHIKAKALKTKVVVLTGYPEREPGVRALGYDGFLTKPLAIGDFTQMIDSLLVQKDEEELRDTLLGVKAMGATPGQPVAQLLFLEPAPVLSQVLADFFGTTSQSGGTYQVYMAESLEKALAMLLGVHPDIVLLDLMSLQHPGEVARSLLACEFQPKDYIFYLRSRLPDDEQFLASLSAKRWEGNPFEEKGLKELAELVGRTALEHSLVKR